MSSFDKVIGYDEIKKELMIICDSLKNPESYAKLGVTMPHGVFLVGEPGIGKTLLATAIIEESGRKSFTVRKNSSNGSFVSHIGSVFEEARASAPSIVLLDDMDKFANGDSNRRDQEEYVVIQTCIDESINSDVFVIATANDRDVLPDSLLRAGRFDKIIEMECPRGKDAERIVSHFLSQKKVDSRVDSAEIARILSERSCAELEEIVNTAGMYAAYNKQDSISRDNMLKACLRCLFKAPEGIDTSFSTDNKGTAIHEAGHAVIAEILDPGSVAIVSGAGYQGSTKGVTNVCPPEGYFDSFKLMEHRVISILGGKAATELIQGVIDPGVNSDMHRVFRIVERFVDDYCGYGFESFEGRNSSEVLRARKETRTATEIEKYYQTAKRILLDNKDFLQAVIDALVVKETLTGKDIALIKEQVGVKSKTA